MSQSAVFRLRLGLGLGLDLGLGLGLLHGVFFTKVKVKVSLFNVGSSVSS